MSAEGPAEQVPVRQASVDRKRDALSEYVSTLHNASEVAGLIVALEGLAEGDAEQARDEGLAALASQTGLDLTSPEDLRRAILVLGARGQRLSSARQGRAPNLESRDLPALAEGLLQVMETARQSQTDPTSVGPDVTRATQKALALWQRNLPPRDAAETRWWAEVQRAVETRMIPSYLQAARHLDAIEAEPVRGLLFRSPLAVAVLCGLGGLITVTLPVSTPLACLALGLFGAYVLHPAYVRQVLEPLEAAGENLAAEAGRIRRLAGEEPWTEANLELPGVLADLVPLLEGERRAGRTSEAELRAAISAYFDAVAPAFAEADRGDHYLSALRGLVEGRLAREYGRYAAARAGWEGRWVTRIVDTPALSAVIVGLLTLPLSWLASRLSPIPPAIDFPLMIGIFALLGNALPRLLPGTAPSREALIKRLADEQPTLERIP